MKSVWRDLKLFFGRQSVPEFRPPGGPPAADNSLQPSFELCGANAAELTAPRLSREADSLSLKA